MKLRLPKPGEKPLLRGVFHEFAALAAVGAGLVLVAMAPVARAAAAAGIYSGSLAAMLGISATYHRPNWGPKAYLWMKRFDHAAIYLLIAGTYTPFCLLVLKGGTGMRLLWTVWIAAALGVLQALFWVRAPKYVTTVFYLAIGWLIVPFMPQVGHAIGAWGITGLAVGGGFYTVGAIMYALKRPTPLPGIFGYHEIFHAFVVIASVLHFSVVASLVKSFRIL